MGEVENDKENYRLLKLEIAHLRELNQKEEKFYELIIAEKEKALALQAKEYERRLADLNGEAGRLRDMQASYLPRELYEAKIKELDENKEKLMKEVIAPLQAWQNNMQGRMAVILIVWTAVVGFVFYLIQKLITKN